MCSLLPYNSPGSDRSVVALPVAVIKFLPLAAGLGLSLTIVLLHSSHSLAQTVTAQEVARSPSQQSAATQTVTPSPTSAQHLLFVSPILGSDSNADGSQRSPFRTITHALEVAQPNTLIMLTAGTYSIDSGEIFPLILRPGVTIQGDPSTQGRGIVIRGGGAFLSSTSAGQNIAILGANQAQLIGVTVTNPNPRGYGVWVGSGSPVIADNTFTGNSQDGISTVGNSAPLLRNNRFNNSQFNHDRSLTNETEASRPQPISPATPRTATITELPPAATIATLPPSLPTTPASASIAQVPASVSRVPTNTATTDAAITDAAITDTATSTSAVLRSAPSTAVEIPVAAATQPQAAIVPIAHQRSAQPAQSVPPTIAISVPPPDNTLQPAVAQRATPIATAPPTNPAQSVTDLTVANAERTRVSHPVPSNPPPSNPAITNTSRSATPSAAVSQTPTMFRAPTVSRTPVDASRLVRANTASPAPSASSARAIEIPVPPPNPAPRAIEIPVPPPNPASRSTLAYAPRPASTPIPSAFTAPIEIPVPSPESSIVAAAVRNQDLSPPEARNAVPSANLLPVPGGDVPIGNVGDLPRISVASSQMGGLYYASSQIRSNLRYRVVVDASSESIQTIVRSIIPNAFPTSINGQQLMQVGAFSSRDNAEQTVQLLTQNGLLAVIQEID